MPSRKPFAVAILLLSLALPAFAGPRQAPPAPATHPSLVEIVIQWVQSLLPGRPVHRPITPACGSGVDPTGACI